VALAMGMEILANRPQQLVPWVEIIHG